MFKLHLGKIAKNIGQGIGAWITDFVEHLLANRADRDRAARLCRLGAREAAILGDLGNRVADIVECLRDLVPVGIVAPGGLRSAFEDVPGEAAASEAIEIIPSEQAAVDAALNMAKQGDLLLIFGDQINRTWKQIIYFNREEPEEVPAAEAPTPEPAPMLQADDPLATATPVPDAPDIPESLLLGGIRMVRDGRGVRVETEPEESD